MKKGKLPMPSLIKHENAVFDAWKLLTLAGNEPAETVSLPVGPLLVPVAVWQARRYPASELPSLRRA
jgi:hypothetical protein